MRLAAFRHVRFRDKIRPQEGALRLSQSRQERRGESSPRLLRSCLTPSPQCFSTAPTSIFSQNTGVSCLPANADTIVFFSISKSQTSE